MINVPYLYVMVERSCSH